MSDPGSVSAHGERAIEFSRTRLVLLIAGSLLMTAMGAWLFMTGGPPGRSTRPWMVHATGAVAFLFFGAAAVYAVAKAFDRKPGLVLGPTGLVDNSSAVAAGFIPWSDVTGVRIFTFGIQKFLVVRVADPEKYIRRGNPFRRALNRVNTWMCGSPITISSIALRIPFRELHRELATRVARHAGPPGGGEAGSRGHSVVRDW